jgi:hypothetical protein
MSSPSFIVAVSTAISLNHFDWVSIPWDPAHSVVSAGRVIANRRFCQSKNAVKEDVEEKMFRFYTLVTAFLIAHASLSLATPASQWQTLMAPATSAAKTIIAGDNATGALNALNLAQQSLPPSSPRPIECWDMMISASSMRSTEAKFAIQRANDALGCYQQKRAIARGPAFTTSTDPRQESDEDFYTKVHPDQPRVGDVPGLPYQGAGTAERSIVNPCMTTDGHRVPNCQ